ncbi:hypothetical protein ES703_67528 [subsurface metagenome]
MLKSGGVFVLNTPRIGWEETYYRSLFWWIPVMSELIKNPKSLTIRLLKKIVPLKLLIKLKNNKEKPMCSNSNDTLDKVRDLPSDEGWLERELNTIGFRIIEKKRTDNHLFQFTHKFWRNFADKFVKQEKYGHCVLFACKKL